MPDIRHELVVNAPPARVYEAVATPEGLDRWWTLTCAGEPSVGREYALGFGPAYEWRATVVDAEPGRRFELRMGASDADWEGTRVGFELQPDGAGTRLRFHHTGWPEANAHWRISNTCWAAYLRLLRRYLEHGEVVPSDQRLDV